MTSKLETTLKAILHDRVTDVVSYAAEVAEGFEAAPWQRYWRSLIVHPDDRTIVLIEERKQNGGGTIVEVQMTTTYTWKEEEG